MMEDYVTFEQAVKLKELGFDWECFAYYLFDDKLETGRRLEKYNSELCFTSLGYIAAPTLAQAQKWLREFEGLYVQITMGYIYFSYTLMTKKFGAYEDAEDSGFISPEDALSAGINKALELLI